MEEVDDFIRKAKVWNILDLQPISINITACIEKEGTNIRASCYRTVLCKPVYLEKQISPTVDVPEVTTEEMRFSFQNVKHEKVPGEDYFATDPLKVAREEFYLPSVYEK